MGKEQIYDAIVVGSGATGGWAAKELTERGLRVLVLEAGRQLDPLKDYTEHVWPYEVAHRGIVPSTQIYGKRQSVQAKCYACNEYGNQFFVDDVDNPYTTPADKPFDWIRGRQVGGRTIMWGRQSYRLSDYDFKAASHDGYGDDWPISYKELAPYYDKVESFIGVSGTYENLPQLPDGHFLPGMKMVCGERLLKRAVEKRWPERRVTIGRTAILTEKHNGRAACHYCGHCERGCTTHSYFSSPGSTLPAAAKTGRLTLQPNAIASHVIMDANTGRAKGVAVIDQNTRRAYEVFGKVVVLCASTIESTRLLLNSATRQHPAGLGNSSGVLGHYLMDHFYQISVSGFIPETANYPYNYDDGRANGVYIPRFRNLTDKQPGFVRGYGIQGSAARQMLPTTIRTLTGFGPEFKRQVREGHAPAPFRLSAFGEMLARKENRVTISKEVKDAWGIPAAHIECAHSDNERAMAKDAIEQLEAMAHEAGFEVVGKNTRLANPGLCIHELGTARMGNDAKTSVLNRFNQSWDVKNLFLTDGACFVSTGCQNPTLTMMAITVRACDYIVDQYKKGNL
ncbi:MAG TPA: GMC family oxidoreductase [Blastocatellia bacterium]|nr:GMC family oxidoreductase [Blastocatellia bacterium]